MCVLNFDIYFQIAHLRGLIIYILTNDVWKKKGILLKVHVSASDKEAFLCRV